MIKGLGRENGFQTFVSIVILIVNAIVFFYAISILGERDAAGKFRFSAEAIPMRYYVLLALNLCFGVISMWFINYPEPNSRWGARFGASLLLPMFLLVLTLNMRSFSWNGFLKTMF